MRDICNFVGTPLNFSMIVLKFLTFTVISLNMKICTSAYWEIELCLSIDVVLSLVL